MDIDEKTFNRIVDNNYKFLSEPLKRIGFKNFEQTLWKGKRSDKSLSFIEGKLDNLFGINEQGVFGQDEKHLSELDSRIHTVHSSALLALQIFNWVGNNNSIKIDDTEYNEVWFEVKNKVFYGPSHIDILLVSADRKNKKLLFLESKFTEYLNGKPCYGISDKYRSFYKTLDMFNGGNELQLSDIYIDGKGKPVFDLFSVTGHASHYCEGFKQVISHYIGLLIGPSEDEKDSDFHKTYEDLFRNATSIKLAEIVYKFDGEDFNNYSGLYTTLAKRLNSLTKEEIEKVGYLQKRENLIVREDLLTYQQLFDINKGYELGGKGQDIKNFYNLQ